MRPLLDVAALEQRSVVANCAMNRLRTLHGSNGYDHELGIDPIQELRQRLTHQPMVRWLDLCCGAGKALIEAAHRLSGLELTREVQIVGVDLVPYFLGADEDAGPNYTGQPSVNSHYADAT